MSDNRFKVIYDNLNEKELLLIEHMKHHATKLSEIIGVSGRTRESSLALTNLEQAMMWAIKGVCVNHKEEESEL